MLEVCLIRLHLLSASSLLAYSLPVADTCRQLAGIVTRSLAEMTRIGTAYGSDPLTMLSLAGVGDLFLVSIRFARFQFQFQTNTD